MDQQRVLVVESDAAFAASVQSTLERMGFEVEVIGDGTLALQVAKSSAPALILLCVELPKMSGYSICNKLKKNPELKSIPLIIMSSEATPDIFEQHKKLKTRAEDYLIKPFAMAELMTKVQFLLGLSDEAQDEAVEIDPIYAEMTDEFPAEEGSESIAIAYGDEVEPDEIPVEEVEVQSSAAAEPSLGLEADIDPDEATRLVENDDIGMATDLAFAALEMPTQLSDRTAAPEIAEPLEGAGRSSPVAPEPLDLGTDLVVEEPASPLVDLSAARSAPAIEDPIETTRSEEYAAGPAAEVSTRAEREEAAQASEELESLHARVNELVRENRRLASEQSRAEGEVERTRQRLTEMEKSVQRVHELERENRRLSDEVQNALARAASGGGEATSGFSRDRELLNLREVINKKEKEILDLKDDLDSKERQILDHKDRVRELERKVRDMDEKLLGVEREIVGANEKVAILQQDKDKIVEREKGIKARLEEAKAEIDKAYAENAEAKNKFKEQLDQREAELASVSAEKQRAIDELTESRDRELAELRAAQSEELSRLTRDQEQSREALVREHEAALSRLDEEKRQAVGELEEKRQREVSELEEKRQREVSELEEKRQREVSELEEKRQRELREADANRESQLQSLRDAHQQELSAEKSRAADEAAALKREQEGALQSLREEHGRELERAREDHHKDLESRGQTHAQELEALRAEHKQELERLSERLGREKEAREAELVGEKEALRTEHQQELERLKTEQRDALERAQREQEQALERAQREQAQELEQVRGEHQRQIEDRRQAHESELKKQQEEHQSQLREQEQRYQKEAEEAHNAHREKEELFDVRVLELEAQVATGKDRLKQVEEDLKKALRKVEEELNKTRQQAEQLERDLSESRDTVARRDATIQEQEQQSASLQEQLLRAYSKIQNDEALADKAKRAMAIALTLLEEQKKISADAAQEEGRAH